MEGFVGRWLVVIAVGIASTSLSVSSFRAVGQGISTVDYFTWDSQGRFDLKLRYEGTTVAFKGGLREFDDSTAVANGAYTAVLTSYRGFLSIIVYPDREEAKGHLYLLKRVNNSYDQMNERPILGRPNEMPEDLKASITRYAALKNWDESDPSACFAVMVSYFEDFPDKELSSFADDAEAGRAYVKSVPKPGGSVVAEPSAPPPGARRAAQGQDPRASRRAYNNSYNGGEPPVPPGYVPYGGGQQDYYGRQRRGYAGGQTRQQYYRPTFPSPFSIFGLQ